MFLLDATADTEIYTRGIVGSVTCVYETDLGAHLQRKVPHLIHVHALALAVEAVVVELVEDALSLIHLSEPTRRYANSYAACCL